MCFFSFKRGGNAFAITVSHNVPMGIRTGFEAFGLLAGDLPGVVSIPPAIQDAPASNVARRRGLQCRRVGFHRAIKRADQPFVAEKVAA